MTVEEKKNLLHYNVPSRNFGKLKYAEVSLKCNYKGYAHEYPLKVVEISIYWKKLLCKN